VRASAWLLSVVVGLVLLLACTNLAGFLLAQAVDRKKEISLRLALGATRGNLIAQLLTESMLLALVGGAAGIAVGVAILRVLTGADMPLPVPMTLDLSLDLTVLGYALAVSMAAGLFLGLAPAVQSSRPDVASTLKEEGAGGGQPGKLTLRNVLIGVQVATSTVLLVGAALFLRSLQETAAVDPGFGHDPAAVMTMLVSGQRFDEEAGRRYTREIVQEFERLPGVESVGLTGNLHLNTLSTSNTYFNVDGVEPPPDREGHIADTTRVDAAFFDATGIRIVAGRNFNDFDLPDKQRVTIINENLAERFFPEVDPVGRMLRKGEDGSEDLLIVGVASNAKIRTLGEAPRSFIYRPLSQDYTSFLTVVARTSRDPEAVAVEMLQAAQAHDPEFWAWETKTMERHVGGMLFPAQLSALVLSAFAVLAIALAAIGLYGVVAYAVSQRTREIGIRMSLGANAGEMVRMLMTTGLRPVLWGSLVGLLLSLALSRLAGTLLFGVSGFDPLAFLGTAVVLTLTALGAAWLPARRASRVSPSMALRFE
jgi:predicted permease